MLQGVGHMHLSTGLLSMICMLLGAKLPLGKPPTPPALCGFGLLGLCAVALLMCGSGWCMNRVVRKYADETRCLLYQTVA